MSQICALVLASERSFSRSPCFAIVSRSAQTRLTNAMRRPSRKPLQLTHAGRHARDARGLAARERQHVDLRRGVAVALADEREDAAVRADQRRRIGGRVRGERPLHRAVGRPQPQVGQSLVLLHVVVGHGRDDCLAIGRDGRRADALDLPGTLGAEGHAVGGDCGQGDAEAQARRQGHGSASSDSRGTRAGPAPYPSRAGSSRSMAYMKPLDALGSGASRFRTDGAGCRPLRQRR